MKPALLLNTLMHAAGITGTTELAARVGRPELQGQFHRYLHGGVKSPRAATLAPLAAFFRVPLDAFFFEDAAQRVADAKGLKAVPIQPRRAKETPKSVSAAAQAMAARIEGMSPDERRRLALLLEAASIPPATPEQLELVPGWNGKERRKRQIKTPYKRRAGEGKALPKRMAEALSAAH